MNRGWMQPAAAGALLGAAVGAVTNERPADIALFARAGRDVLSGHLAAVYGSTANQAGPLQALLSRLLVVGSDGSGVARPVLVVLDAVLIAVVAALAFRAAGALRAALAAGYAALWLAGPAFWGGHPVEVLIPALWLLAARRDGACAGLALAGAALVAPWGVLGWPVVLRRGAAHRPTAVALLAAAVGTVAGYAPLLLAGHGTAAQHVWPVDGHSLVHLAFPHLHHVGWGLRLVQGVLVLAVLAALARRLPDSPVRAPLLVTAVGLLRVATDPITLDYYWLPAATGALALLVAVPRLRSRAGVASVAVAYLAWLAAPLHLVAVALAGLVVLAVGFGPVGYPRQIRSSSARKRAAGSAVRGPSR